MEAISAPASLFAQRLIAVLALSVLGLALSAGLYIQYIDLVNMESERLQMQARVIKENAEENLLSLNSALSDLLEQDASTPSTVDLNRYLNALSDGMPSVRKVSVLDPKGRVLASSMLELVDSNVGDREYFLAVARRPSSQTLYISRPYRSVLGIDAISVSRMRPGRSGEFNGVVAATLNRSYFSPLLESVRYAPDMRVALVHASGDVFLSLPENNALEKTERLVQRSLLESHLRGGSDTSVFPHSQYSGADHMTIMTTIAPRAASIDHHLVIVVDRDRKEVLSRWRQNVWIFGTLYALLLLVSMSMLLRYQRRLREANLKAEEAARAQRESEHLMKTVTDHLPAMVAYWGRDLHCRFANGAYLEWFGRTPEQMTGIHIRDLLGEALFIKNEPHINGALRGELQQFERTLTKTDGTTGYTWAQYIPDTDGESTQGFFVLVADVTPLKEAQIALAESEWKLRTIVETEPECVALLSTDGRIMQLNPAGVEMLEAGTEERACSTDIRVLIAPRHREAFDNLVSAVNKGELQELTFELKSLAGRLRWLECRAVPMHDRSQQLTGLLCVMRDVTARKKAEEQLAYMAQTDFLTDLANRRHFMTQAAQEVERIRRYGGSLTILMMDIDHFKKINDAYGHKTGDLVIRKLADLCRGTLRSLDIVGRIGGEEFAVLLPETDRADALQVSELLRERAERAEVWSEQQEHVSFTVSIGLASRNGGDGIELEKILAEADSALYQAKNSGRNRVCEYRFGIRPFSVAS